MSDWHEYNEQTRGEPTLGEIMRVLRRVERLAERTNGRVDRAETNIAVLTTRMDDFGKSVHEVVGRANGGLVGGGMAALGVVAQLLWRMVGK